MGVIVSEATVEMMMANASVIENSRNSRPGMPPRSSNGMNAAMSDTEIETTVKPIWPAPASAACIGDSPASRFLSITSIMTMASSTTKPTDVASAIKDMLSIEKPAAYMQAQVPAKARGTVTPAAAVGVMRRRKTKTTAITSMIVASNVPTMSLTLARIVVVLSLRIEISMPAGRKRFSSGNNAFTRSTVWITLASDCLVIWMRTEGFPLKVAMERALRTLLSTVATSDSSTLPPLVFFTTSLP